MSKKSTTQYTCQSCGSVHLKWQGKCPDCGTWGSVQEELTTQKFGFRQTASSGQAKLDVLALDQIKLTDDTANRMQSKIGDFDQIVGGGLVPGSVVLMTGDPGIGKSTLLLQVAAGFAKQKKKILYISGEESREQIYLRAKRLNLVHENIFLANETNCESIVGELLQSGCDLAIIDSIQTLFHPELTSAPGSVSQVRECAARLLEVAKRKNIAVILVGHVTKDGQVAGPRVLEHLVDTVLALEGDPQSGLRLLRANKNRFGSTGEIGVFEMQGDGLFPVMDPSQYFFEQSLGDPAHKRTSGVLPTITIEGSRPFVIEVQALTTRTHFGNPKRTNVGLDQNRVTTLLATLEKRGGFQFWDQDVYLTLSGGVRVFEPGIDLALCIAMMSSLLNKAVSPKMIFLGEVALSGELKPVTFVEKRIQEAKRLKFDGVILPERQLKREGTRLFDIANHGSSKIKLQPLQSIHDMSKLELF